MIASSKSGIHWTISINLDLNLFYRLVGETFQKVSSFAKGFILFMGRFYLSLKVQTSRRASWSHLSSRALIITTPEAEDGRIQRGPAEAVRLKNRSSFAAPKDQATKGGQKWLENRGKPTDKLTDKRKKKTLAKRLGNPTVVGRVCQSLFRRQPARLCKSRTDTTIGQGKEHTHQMGSESPPAPPPNHPPPGLEVRNSAALA